MQYLLFAEFKQVFPDSRDPLSDFQVLKMEHNEITRRQFSIHDGDKNDD